MRMVFIKSSGLLGPLSGGCLWDSIILLAVLNRILLACSNLNRKRRAWKKQLHARTIFIHHNDMRAQ